MDRWIIMAFIYLFLNTFVREVLDELKECTRKRQSLKLLNWGETGANIVFIVAKVLLFGRGISSNVMACQGDLSPEAYTVMKTIYVGVQFLILTAIVQEVTEVAVKPILRKMLKRS